MTTISATGHPGGVALAVGEVLVNWGNWQWWPFWLVDFIAAGLLLCGGNLVLRGRHPLGTHLLMGAWGFSAAMFYMSFWSHIRELYSSTTVAPSRELLLTGAIGVLLLASVAGFVLSAGSQASPGSPERGRAGRFGA